MVQRPRHGAGIRRGLVLGLPVDAAPSLETASRWLAGQLAAAPGAVGRARLVTFVNPAAVACAKRNPAFHALLQRFDLVLPDGIGMALAIRALLGRQAARISFDSTSLALPVFGHATEQGRSIAFVGGRPGVAARAQQAIQQRFPALRCIGAWSGHGDMTATIRDLAAAAPDLVVCGMGSVAQEAFLQDLAEAGWTGIGITCGGYLDQLAGGLRYYPGWVDALNLRWAYRLWREPERLWRRYLLDYGHFGRRFLAAWLARPVAAARRDLAAGGGA